MLPSTMRVSAKRMFTGTLHSSVMREMTGSLEQLPSTTRRSRLPVHGGRFSVGLILRMTDRDGIHPIGWLNRTLGIIVNALRSIPFIILMVAMLPVAKFVVGTSLGNRAVIVTLVIAAAPYVARMVESAAKEVNAGVIEAAQSMGASTFRIIWKVIIPEAKPALITGGVISTVTILGYSAMAGTIGGGGLGQIAITYGYQKYDDQIVWLCVALTILIVQILQEFGMYIARRTDRRAHS